MDLWCYVCLTLVCQDVICLLLNCVCMAYVCGSRCLCKGILVGVSKDACWKCACLPVTMWFGSTFSDETMPAGRIGYLSRVGG